MAFIFRDRVRVRVVTLTFIFGKVLSTLTLIPNLT